MDVFTERANKTDTLTRILFALVELKTRMGRKSLLKWAERIWGNDGAWHFKHMLRDGEEPEKHPWESTTLPTPEEVLRILNKKLGKKYVSDDFLDYVSSMKVFLLDLPDYTKHTMTYMNRDLSNIQSFWEKMIDANADGFFPNIVLFIQKELFHGHFFFGKCDVFEIRSFKPEELVDYYKRKFKDYLPFTEEALTEIACLSRGIFRRFKKYILICLDNWYDLLDSNKITVPHETKEKNMDKLVSLSYNSLENNMKTIVLDDIKEWVTLDQLVKDMELELYDLFPKSKELLKSSVIMLRFLREHGPTSQLFLTAKLFDGYKMGCSRMLKKLEVYGYVKSQKEGKQKIWSLV